MITRKGLFPSIGEKENCVEGDLSGWRDGTLEQGSGLGRDN